MPGSHPHGLAPVPVGMLSPHKGAGLGRCVCTESSRWGFLRRAPFAEELSKSFRTVSGPNFSPQRCLSVCLSSREGDPGQGARWSCARRPPPPGLAPGWARLGPQGGQGHAERIFNPSVRLSASRPQGLGCRRRLESTPRGLVRQRACAWTAPRPRCARWGPGVALLPGSARCGASEGSAGLRSPQTTDESPRAADRSASSTECHQAGGEGCRDRAEHGRRVWTAHGAR